MDKVRCSALFSRSLTFLFPIKVLTIFSQILVRQLLLQFRVKSCFKIFFALSLSKKVRRSPGVRVRGCTRTRAHPRRRCRGRSPSRAHASCGHRVVTSLARVRNNNNNNTIWGGSEKNRRRASTPLWGEEACSLPSRRPNPMPAIPHYVVRTPHLHGAPTTEETVKP